MADRSAYDRDYYQRNRERRLAQMKHWSATHREYHRKKGKEYRDRNRDVIKVARELEVTVAKAREMLSAR